MGRRPKPPHQLSRARDARRQRPWVEFEGVPAGQPRLAGARRQRPETRAWWRAWCSSPQAAEFWSTDWQRLQMLALLVDAYFCEPKASVLREIRRNEVALSGRDYMMNWASQAESQPGPQGRGVAEVSPKPACGTHSRSTRGPNPSDT